VQYHGESAPGAHVGGPLCQEYLETLRGAARSLLARLSVSQ
jgi:hypothetical protein